MEISQHGLAYIPLAVSRIAHTVAVCMLFECVSTAQKWIDATPRKINVGFAGVCERFAKVFVFSRWPFA